MKINLQKRLNPSSPSLQNKKTKTKLTNFIKVLGLKLYSRNISVRERILDNPDTGARITII